MARRRLAGIRPRGERGAAITTPDEEIAATIDLRVAPDGTLHLWSRGRDLLPLRPTFRDGMTDDPEFPERSS